MIRCSSSRQSGHRVIRKPIRECSEQAMCVRALFRLAPRRPRLPMAIIDAAPGSLDTDESAASLAYRLVHESLHVAS